MCGTAGDESGQDTVDLELVVSLSRDVWAGLWCGEDWRRGRSGGADCITERRAIVLSE